MATNRQIRELLDATAYDVNGDKLGAVNEVYINDTSGQPDFIEVNHGLFGMGSSLVPLRGHTVDGENLRLAFAKDRVEDAPNIDADAHLSREDQANLYAHYGLDSAQDTTTYEPDYGRDPRVEAGVAGAGVEAGVDRDVDTTGVVRSEERLNVDKDRVETGDVRLRKYVVHDTETVEVPVEREEVRVERTPIDANDPAARREAGTLGEDEASVTLHEERVNVTKESVPVEKVDLNKETVRSTETVSEDVAKEQVEVEGDHTQTDRDRR